LKNKILQTVVAMRRDGVRLLMFVMGLAFVAAAFYSADAFAGVAGAFLLLKSWFNVPCGCSGNSCKL
jgi:hypothetical protein